MSWQRIFELARKQGIPMIVTDIMGLEPMVVLPLDQFEALTETAKDLPTHAPKPASEEPTVTPEPPSSVDHKKLLAEITPNLSTEERFYLEPIEDAWTEPRV